MSNVPSVRREAPSWEVGFCLPHGLRATLQPELENPSDFVRLTPTQDQMEAIVETLDAHDDEHRAEKVLYVLLDSAPLEWQGWDGGGSRSLPDSEAPVQPDATLGITAEWLEPVGLTVPGEQWQNLLGLTYPLEEQGFAWVLLTRLLA